MVVRCLAISALLIVCLVQWNDSLSCVPCMPPLVNCTNDLKKCQYGLAKDMCGCCDVCAKGAGESCGGVWNHGGTCGKGLTCHPNPDPEREQDAGSCSTKPLPPGFKPKFP